MIDPPCATHLLVAMSHDVRTPLNSMMLTLKWLEDKHRDRLDAEDRADFATIRAGIRSILDLHADILRHAVLAEGRIAPAEAEFPLGETLAGCAEIIRPLAADKGLSVDLDLRATPIIRSDRSLVRRIVGNLLSNAVRYTDTGSIVLRSRLDGDGLAIEVEDTGIGIASEDRGRVFEPYYRAAPARGDGQGLGLAIARQAAEFLCGTLTMQSEVGRGSTFTLSLSGCIRNPTPSADGD